MQDARSSDSSRATIIGVDVAKASFVAAIFGADASCMVANTPTAIRAWLKRMPPGSSIAMESTGRYHLELASQAKAAGMVVYVLNAMDVHYYAKAMGQRGKTDALDASLIAQYVAHQLMGNGTRRLRPWEPAPQVLSQLRDLLNARAQLSNSNARLSMALEHIALLSEEAKALGESFQTLMARIEAKVAALVSGDAQLAQGCKLLRSITG